MADPSYVLLVHVRFYDNPTNRCEECGTGSLSQTCCDAQRQGSCAAEQDSLCDNRFYYCLRELDRTDVENNPLNCQPMFSTVNTDAAVINFDQSSVLGLANPLSLTGPMSTWEVSHMLLP